MKLQNLLHPIVFSFISFFLLSSPRPVFAQTTTVEMVLESISRLATDVKHIGSLAPRCAQVVSHKLWERSEAQRRQFEESNKTMLDEARRISLQKMEFVRYTLFEEPGPYGVAKKFDPAVRDHVFPEIDERISRLIAEAPTFAVIDYVHQFLFYELAPQLTAAMRQLIAIKASRVMSLIKLSMAVLSLESGSIDEGVKKQMDSLVQHYNKLIWTTATDLHTVDTLVEAATKDIWELCPNCK